MHSTIASNSSSNSKIGTETWEKFFDACCDIPSEMKKKYASAFVKQRIQPHLLRDLGKDDLRELGINALGDQLAIINYINSCDGNPPEFAPPSSIKKAAPHQPVRTVHRNEAYVDDDDILMLEEEDVIPHLSQAPDRHDIYHIKMPSGETKSQRAKNILEMHNTLREQGVIKRGVTGVRRSGMELNSVSSNSKSIQKQQQSSPLKPKLTAAALTIQDTDITSSTAAGWLPTRSLRSDAISTKTMVVKDSNSIINQKGRGMIANRLISSNTSGAKIPVRVNLGNNNDIVDALKAPLIRSSPIKRQTVRYEQNDGILNFGEDEEFIEEDFTNNINITRNIPKIIPKLQQHRKPISERIQLIRKRPGVEQGIKRQRRPIITLDGRKLILGGGNEGGGRRKSNNNIKGIGGGSKGGGVSILQRISF